MLQYTVLLRVATSTPTHHLLPQPTQPIPILTATYINATVHQMATSSTTLLLLLPQLITTNHHQVGQQDPSLNPGGPLQQHPTDLSQPTHSRQAARGAAGCFTALSTDPASSSSTSSWLKQTALTTNPATIPHQPYKRRFESTTCAGQHNARLPPTPRQALTQCTPVYYPGDVETLADQQAPLQPLRSKHEGIFGISTASWNWPSKCCMQHINTKCCSTPTHQSNNMTTFPLRQACTILPLGLDGPHNRALYQQQQRPPP